MILLDLKDLEIHLCEAAHIITGPIDASDYKTFIFQFFFFKPTRYSKQATASLKAKWKFIRSMLKAGISRDSIITENLQPLIDDAPFVNYWKVGMSDGLIRYLWNNQTI